MNVIVIGSANSVGLLPRDSLPTAMTGEDPLARFAGGKFPLADYTHLPLAGRRSHLELTVLWRGRKRTIVLTIPSEMQFSPGGSAISIAVGLAGIGLRPQLITALRVDPPDFFARGIEEYARRKGVTPLHTFPRLVTPITFTIWGLEAGDERSIVFTLKPPYAMTKRGRKEAIRKIRSLAGPFHVVATGTRHSAELKFVQEVFQIAQRRDSASVRYFMPSEALLSIRAFRPQVRAVLGLSSVWQMNQQEAVAYLQATKKRRDERLRISKLKPRELLRRLSSSIPSCPSILVTKGAQGVAAKFRDRQFFEIPAHPVSMIVDTAGAGDAFAVGFFAGLSLNCSPKECLRLATFSAAGKIAAVGEHVGIPSGETLQQFLTQLREDTAPHR